MFELTVTNYSYSIVNTNSPVIISINTTLSCEMRFFSHKTYSGAILLSRDCPRMSFPVKPVYRTCFPYVHHDCSRSSIVVMHGFPLDRFSSYSINVFIRIIRILFWMDADVLHPTYCLFLSPPKCKCGDTLNYAIV